jgi:TolB-like protein
MEVLTPEIVRLHLARILNSPSFSVSVVLTRFLTFIVNETLEGRSHELKEYTIAIDALKKDVDFNPQIDAIVRIHACRLRRALKEFYYEHGAGEDVQILLRKGSYVPAFVKNHSDHPSDHDTIHMTVTPKGSNAKHRNVLAILPFDDISETKIHTPFVRGLDVYLSTYLTTNPKLCLVSNLSSSHLPDRIKDVREAGIYLNASFILTGCVQFDKHLRVHVLLNACATGEQLWGMTIGRKDVEMTDLFLLQEEIVDSIGASLNGVVEQYCQADAARVFSSMNINEVATVGP